MNGNEIAAVGGCCGAVGRSGAVEAVYPVDGAAAVSGADLAVATTPHFQKVASGAGCGTVREKERASSATVAGLRALLSAAKGLRRLQGGNDA